MGHQSVPQQLEPLQMNASNHTVSEIIYTYICIHTY